jgi:hypothetical protein
MAWSRESGKVLRLRRMAGERGLPISTITLVEKWVFHMALAYCPKLSETEWSAVAQFIETPRG